MTTNWSARAARFATVAAKLQAPDWARRVALVSHRLTPSTCSKCGGRDFIHFLSCSRRFSFGSTRVAFGNAVIRAAEKHEANLRMDVDWKRIKAAAVESGLWALIQSKGEQS